MPNYHGIMIDKMKSLGYQSNDQGVCQGLTMMWIQSVLAKQVPIFKERMKYVVTTQDLAEKVKEVQEKNKKKIPLTTSEDKFYASMMPFYFGVELYYRPGDYYELFQAMVRQIDITKVSEYVIPELLETTEKKEEKLEKKEKNKIGETYNELVIGNKNEVQTYFESLKQKILELQTEDYPLPVFLGSMSHAMAVTYDTKKKLWNFYDSNQYPKHYEIPDDKIAETVMDGFEENNVTGFSAIMLTTSDNPHYKKICESMTTFRNSHPLTLEHFAKRTDHNDSLATIAARRGHAHIFREMPKLQLSMDVKESDERGGFPAQFSAALSGNFSILYAMQNNGIDLNASHKAMKVSTVAVLSSNRALIPQLHDIGVDFDSNAKESFPPINPLSVAFSEQNWNSVIAVLFAKKQFNTLTNFYLEQQIKPNKRALEQAFIDYFQDLNVISLNPEAIKHLAKNGLDFNSPCFKNQTGLSTLANMKRWDVVIHMLATMPNASGIQAPLFETLLGKIPQLEDALVKYLVDKKGYVSLDSMLTNTALGILLTKKSIEQKLALLDEKSYPGTMFVSSNLINKPNSFGLIKEDDISMILSLSAKTIKATSRYLVKHPDNTLIKKDVKDIFTKFKFGNLLSLTQPFQSHSHQDNATDLEKTSVQLVTTLNDANCHILQKYKAYLAFFESVTNNYINIKKGDLKTFMDEENVLDNITDCISSLYFAKYQRLIPLTIIKNNLNQYAEEVKQILKTEIAMYNDEKKSESGPSRKGSGKSGSR